jgi:LemA protein
LIKGSSIDYGMAESRSNLKIVIVVAVVAILVLMSLWVVLAYNGTVSNQQDVDSKESQIKNRYTTKVDTLGPLLDQVESYKVYESTLLQNITELRTRWYEAIDQGADTDTLSNISTQIDTQFGTVLATWENYPVLTASAIVSQYMGEVVDQNEALSYSRLQYNEAVRDYNSGIKSFPMMLFASSFGFEEREYWGSERPGDGSNL